MALLAVKTVRVAGVTVMHGGGALGRSSRRWVGGGEGGGDRDRGGADRGAPRQPGCRRSCRHDAGGGLDAGGAADGGAVDDRLAGPGDGVGAGAGLGDGEGAGGEGEDASSWP